MDLRERRSHSESERQALSRTELELTQEGDHEAFLLHSGLIKGRTWEHG